MVPCLGTSIRLLLLWSNTLVSNAFGLWISVCAHGSVSSLVQTRLIMVACLFKLEPKWLRLTWIIPCKCLVLLVYPSFVQMVLSLESGDCGATCSCIASFNYFENYAPDGSCVIKLAFLVTLDVKDFTESRSIPVRFSAPCRYRAELPSEMSTMQRFKLLGSSA